MIFTALEEERHLYKCSDFIVVWKKFISRRDQSEILAYSLRATASFLNPLLFLEVMVKHTGSYRRKNKELLTKSPHKRGKISLTKYFATYKEGQKVLLALEPSVSKGLYFLRYHGKIGVVKGKQGRCYQVHIKDGGKEKQLIVHPVHLKGA